MRRCVTAMAMLIVTGTFWNLPVYTQAPAPAGRPGAPAPAPTTKPAGPPAWPSAAVLAQRKRDADNRRLFQQADPLEFTLTSDFKGIDRDRDPASTRTFPGTLSFNEPNGTAVSKPVRLRGRGHSRRNPKICDFSPLRVEFTKDAMAGTIFEGHNALKLGTHCRSNATFEQYVLREYTAYRIFNALTPNSFRARLARGTYVEVATGKPVATRIGLFLEDDDDVARRMEGRMLEQKGLRFRHVDPEYLTLLALFEYMIGNTDVSIFSVHNVEIVERPDGKRFPVPYDFDYSGLVNTLYAVVDKNLFHIASVRDRVYRGPCRPLTDLQPFFDRFKSARPAITALYDDQPEFSDNSRRDAKEFLDEFYKTIDSPTLAKRAFVDGCVKEGLM